MIAAISRPTRPAIAPRRRRRRRRSLAALAATSSDRPRGIPSSRASGPAKPALRLPQLNVVEERGSAVVLLPGRDVALEPPARLLGVAALGQPPAHRRPAGDQRLVGEVDALVRVRVAGCARGGRAGERHEPRAGESVEHALEHAVVVALAAQVVEP